MELSIINAVIREWLGEEQAYAAIAQAGFDGIDWDLAISLPSATIRSLKYEGTCIFEKSLDAVIAHYTPELEIIKKNGLKILQAHAPFPSYVPGHPEILEYAIGIYKRCIELCDYVGCKNLVIHGISLAADDRENTPESIEKLNWHLYESLIPTLQKCNVTVCLENLFTWGTCALEGVCADPHEAVRYIDVLNEKAGKEAFGLCLDTGHLMLLGKTPRNYMPILGKRIKALHIHDNDGRVDRHLAPMTGKVNWTEFCQILRDIGYDGNINFETHVQSQVALQFDRDMLMPWLELIRKTGECFRKKIQG